MVLKIAVVAALGVPPVAVVLFEVILNGMAMFNHSNLALSPRVDSILRRLVVTPDMHRVHHSVLTDETNRNFGFNLSIWDHLFGSYRAQPRDGHAEMEIGLSEYRDASPSHLGFTLSLPFQSATNGRRSNA